jgi:hypothetical protein
LSPIKFGLLEQKILFRETKLNTDPIEFGVHKGPL